MRDLPLVESGLRGDEFIPLLFRFAAMSDKNPQVVEVPPEKMLVVDAVRNAIATRTSMLKSFLDPRRNIDKECGYPDTIKPEEYRYMYDRELGKRVVDFEPEKCWREPPKVYEDPDPETETAFEKAWKELCEKYKIWSLLERLDKLSGIGRFGILLVGLSGDEELSKPATGKKDLLYLRPFDENCVKVSKFVGNERDSRFGQPEEYHIQFVEPEVEALLAADDRVQPKGESDTKTLVVHWSRCQHVLDGVTSSEIYGSPRMESVFNRLMDLRKTAAGSGEMFWKGAFPGIAFEMDSDATNTTIDVDSIKQEMDDYANTLKRWIAVEGLTAKSLQTQVSDPGPHIDKQIELICMTKGWPKRIFMGSERGELSSSQDAIEMNGALRHRQIIHCEANILRPFIQMMIAFQILPEPSELIVEWEDLNTPSDKERVENQKTQTEALAAYMSNAVSELVPEAIYFTQVLGWPMEIVQEIMEQLEARLGAADDDSDVSEDDSDITDPDEERGDV